ncbi:MAG: response regulator transcription factor [Aphanocapsa sp. GSE-SYN-MK-11-07L]|jgi:DNA-binding NarL/FixJ family response regulator|nr:response regulator transcription factor [Aphanocapsa sp. GSE-SYN-MK-11-07L]
MIRVVIVDDQKIFTQGLSILLESEPDIKIVGTGFNGQDAIKLVKDLLPDVLLIDQYMPVMDGVEATKLISNSFPQVSILLLSGSDQNDLVAKALKAGAKGYLLKDTSAEDLANSIRSLNRGYSQLGPGLLEKLLAQENAADPADTLPIPSDQPDTRKQVQQLIGDPAQFEIDAILGLLASINDRLVAVEVINQLEKQLQRTPKHVCALYLTGQLIYKFKQQAPLAMKYFKVAFESAQTQGFDLLVRLHISRAAWSVNPSEAFTWLSEILQQWPEEQSCKIFFNALVQVFEPSTEVYRLLQAYWQIQSLNKLCEQADGLESKLHPLLISSKLV